MRFCPVSKKKISRGNPSRYLFLFGAKMYKQLDYRDRLLIEIMVQEKRTYKEISERIGITVQGLSKEFSRCGGREKYSARVAQESMLERNTLSNDQIEILDRLIRSGKIKTGEYIEELGMTSNQLQHRLSMIGMTRETFSADTARLRYAKLREEAFTEEN